MTYKFEYAVGDRVDILCENIPNTDEPIPSNTGRIFRHADEEELRGCSEMLPYMVRHPCSALWWYGAEHLRMHGKPYPMEVDFTLDEIELAEKMIGHEQ